MINYFNFKQIKEKFLITNDFGKFSLLSKSDFNSLVTGKINPDSEMYHELCEKLFIFDSSPTCFIEFAQNEMKNSKNYVFSATSLQIFVVTNAGNMDCVYCQANNGLEKPKDFMSIDIAEKAVNLALSSPSANMTFEFQGGEPLMNFPVIKHIVEYTEKNKKGKLINYTIVTNLTLLTDEMIQFFKEYNISISTSLDGNEILHNLNRTYKDKKETFSDVIKSVDILRKHKINIGAIQTTTRNSLPLYKEIINTYKELGFSSIFIRPLTPLGCAYRKWSNIGYTPDEFIQFYRKSLEYIIFLNKSGYFMSEGHASIFLSKIIHNFPINYMELRSPCGAAVGEMAYYPNGDVFTCDEGRMLYEMGDDSFKLGNVNENSYYDMIHSNTYCAVCKASILESLPNCCDCVYQPYCGVCPVINLAIEHDVISKAPNNYRCKIYSGMLDTIFELLQNETVFNYLEKW